MAKLIELNDKSQLYIDDKFLSNDKADKIFALALKLDLEKNPTCVVFGKECKMHRSIGFFTLDDNIDGYKYFL